LMSDLSAATFYEDGGPDGIKLRTLM